MKPATLNLTCGRVSIWHVARCASVQFMPAWLSGPRDTQTWSTVIKFICVGCLVTSTLKDTSEHSKPSLEGVKDRL